MSKERQQQTISKKVRIIMGITMVAVIGLGYAGMQWYMPKTGEIRLNLSDLRYEYGEIINIDKTTFIQTDNEYYDDINIEFSEYEVREVGEHPIVFKYKGKKIDECKVIVEDTTAPSFVDFNSNLRLEPSAEINLLDYYAAIDRSGEVDIKIESNDNREIDTTKDGMYSVIVTAKDQYGNESKEFGTIEFVRKENNAEGQEYSQPITESQIVQWTSNVNTEFYEINKTKQEDVATDKQASEVVRQKIINAGFTVKDNAIKSKTETVLNPEIKELVQETAPGLKPDEEETKVIEEIKNLREIPEWGFKTKEEAEKVAEDTIEKYSDAYTGYQIIEEKGKFISYYYIQYQMVITKE